MKSFKNTNKSKEYNNKSLIIANDYSEFLNDKKLNNNFENNIEKQIIKMDFNDTSEIKIPEKLIDQVLGQDDAVNIIKKAALQHRHVIMIGIPGTGKSLLARAMTELLPSEKLEDILIYPNIEDTNNPLVRCVPRKRKNNHCIQ